MTLGERIAQARKQAGLSQEQLGEKLGVSRQAISKWESGQTNPDVAYVAELCRLFGISSDWLLLGLENAQESAPVRCPNCKTVVTGLDNFCPNCGHSLQEKPCTYTLVVAREGHIPVQIAEEIVSLMNFHLLPDSTLIAQIQGREQVIQLLEENSYLPLARGLSKDLVERIIDKLSWSDKDAFRFYRDGDSAHLDELNGKEPIPMAQLQKKNEPMSFGGMVLAVIVGVIAAIFLLALL
ncbi:helix-turn-helix domain-containing protein [Lawsonibacter sp. LCP25S3_G6]|uniref:helix-turn-helix domain-containing protein n=1 Tax=unclassified Lawsonibacter TaxID=2617946 RepID=UPI003F98892B